MEHLKFDLQFFAKLLQTTQNKLEFVIVKRKYHDESFGLFPCIKVKDIDNYVFDLNSGTFVRLGNRYDSTVTLLKTFVVKTDQGILMRTKRGHSVTFTENEFKQIYGFRVVNPLLY